MDFTERSDLQLLRASRGAHELTKRIDSWSKYLTADARQQRCIADDLLRRATELQESLLMLSRFQGASFRKMPTMKRVQRGREDDDAIICNGSEMRQVVRNRMFKFYNENISSTKSSRRLEKMKAPNLIAKLMGLEDFPTNDRIKEGRGKEKAIQVENKKLEDIFEIMRSVGVLKSETSLTTDSSNVPPIVIMRPQQFPRRERVDQNLTSQTSNLLLEEDDIGCVLSENLESSSVVRVEEEVFASQKQLKRAAAFKEKKKTDDRKQKEKKVLKAIGIKLEKRGAATSSSSQKRNFNFSMKPSAASSIRSAKEEKISLERKPVIKLSKIEDEQIKSGNLSSITKNDANSTCRSISGVDGLYRRQVEKEPTRSIMKDSIRKGHKVICEVMPKNYKMGRSLERIEVSMRKVYYKPCTKYEVEIKSHLKPLLLANQSFFNHVHELLGTNVRKPASTRTKFSTEQETVSDQLLLDSAKEMITRQTRDGKLSTHQIMRNGMRNQSAERCFGELVDEICNGIKKLESYSEFDDEYGVYKDGLDCICEKDLRCSDTMLNAIWDDGWDCWICMEAADEPFVDLVERIIFGLLLELAKDLLSSEKGNV